MHPSSSTRSSPSASGMNSVHVSASSATSVMCDERRRLAKVHMRAGQSTRPYKSTSIASKLGRHRDLLEQVDLLEGHACTDHRAADRFFGVEHREAGLFAQEHVEVPEERGATREDDAAIDDVTGQLGGRTLEADADRLGDGVDGLGHRLSDFVRVALDRL